MGHVLIVVFQINEALFLFFFLKGRKQEGDESGYERISDIYEDLMTLVKSRSPHFADNINKQVQWNTDR